VQHCIYEKAAKVLNLGKVLFSGFCGKLNRNGEPFVLLILLLYKYFSVACYAMATVQP
jgi:hypothetical protein